MPTGPEHERQQYWLRPMGLEHIAEVTRWHEQLEDLAMFDRHRPLPVSVAAMEAEWREAIVAREPRTSYWFVVCDDHGRPAGCAGLQGINYPNGDAVMAILVANGFRRRGIAIRCAALLFDLAFDQLRLIRVTSFRRADNEPSRALTDVCGFRLEGCIRRGWFSDGRHVDLELIGMLDGEWRAQRESLAAGLDAATVVTLGGSAERTLSWPPERARSARVRRAT